MASEPRSATAQVVNVTNKTRTLKLSQGIGMPPIEYEIEPGKAVKIPTTYALRPKHKSGQLLPSIVDKLTAAVPGEWGTIRPATDPLAADILAGKRKPVEVDVLGRIVEPAAKEPKAS